MGTFFCLIPIIYYCIIHIQSMSLYIYRLQYLKTSVHGTNSVFTVLTKDGLPQEQLGHMPKGPELLRAANRSRPTVPVWRILVKSGLICSDISWSKSWHFMTFPEIFPAIRLCNFDKNRFVFWEILTYLYENAAYYLLCWPSFNYWLINIWVRLSKFMIVD